MSHTPTTPRTATILGASGAVGQELLPLLLQSAHYSSVKSIGRRPLPLQHPKLTQHCLAFDTLAQQTDLLTAHDVFVCVGTTIAKAGSREAFRQVDFHIPVDAALALAQSSVQHFIVISSIGAGTKSSGFYLRTKTEMEVQLRQLLGHRLHIVRPSLLLAQRSEFRLGEEIGKGLNTVISPFLLGKAKKYRGIKTTDVAKAMLSIALGNDEKQTYESDYLQLLANQFDQK